MRLQRRILLYLILLPWNYSKAIFIPLELIPRKFNLLLNCLPLTFPIIVLSIA